MTANSIVRIGFHGGEIEAVKQGDDVWVSIRRMCEHIGIDHSSQIAKLKEKRWARMVLIPTRDQSGRIQQTSMLHLDAVPMWLGGIETNRVTEDARPILDAYQLECAIVLRDHFFGRAKTSANEERLARREERLARKQAADGYRLAINLARTSCPSMVRTYEAKQAAVLAGEDFGELFRTDSTVEWKSAEQIAAEIGCSSQRVGLTVSELWGRVRCEREGLMTARITKAAHCDKQVPQWFYSDAAVKAIRAHLAEQHSATDTDTVNVTSIDRGGLH